MFNMKGKISIRNKTIVCFTVLIVTIIIAQLIFNLFLLKPFVSYTKTKVIENSFNSLKTDYNGKVNNIYQLAEEIQNKHGIKIVLFDHDELIYTTGFSSNQQFNIPMNPALRGQKPKNSPPGNDRFGGFINNTDDFKETPTVEKTGYKDDIGQLVLKGKFVFDGNEVYVVMTLPMESIDTSVSLYTKVSSVIALFALIIGILLAITFSNSLTKPITSVEKVAHSLSDLDFSVLANENVSTAELASLAKSINAMSLKLKISIEDLQIANDELKKDIDYKNQIEDMRRQFVANVSHEMKTPLGLLQIYCENLKNNVDGIDKEYYCNVIIEEVQSLNDMVLSMLDISSIESGLSKMTFEKFDLSMLCKDIAVKFRNAYETHIINFDIENNIFVSGDVKYISQAINNYILNAVSHTQSGCRIEIFLKKAENSAMFSVFNEGEIIDSYSFENIWEPFFKSDKARTRNGNNNTGLGLYIVKTIIEKHNGRVNVQNEANGVNFSFTIPID